MKLGIVGLPNVGKSTLFNAITNAGVAADNYAFCTIDPNVGVVSVPDKRLEWLRDVHNPKKFTPAVIEFVDIAGLVKGASQGEGLGNKFLSNIRNTDAIVHVVRCFDNANVTHVEGSTDPLRDIDIINLELIMADLEMIDRRIEKAQKGLKSGQKAMQKELDVFQELKEYMSAGKLASTFDGTEEELALFPPELGEITYARIIGNTIQIRFSQGGTGHSTSQELDEYNEWVWLQDAAEDALSGRDKVSTAYYNGTKPDENGGPNLLLEQAMERIDGERERRSNDLRVKEQLATATPSVESGFIYSVLFQQNYVREVSQFKDLLGVAEDSGFMMVIEYDAQKETGTLSNTVDLSVQMYENDVRLRETIKEFFPAVIGPQMANTVILFVPCARCPAEQEYEQRIQVIQKARKMVRKLQDIVDARFRVGIGSVKSLEDAHVSYTEAVSSFQFSSGSVAHAGDLPLSCGYEEDYPVETEKAIFECVQRGDAA